MSFADEVKKSVSQPVVLVHVDSVDAGYAGRFSTKEFTPIGASNLYDGRLYSLPAIASSRDIEFFGILKYSSSGITLVNADGDMDTLLEDYNILGSKVRIYYGFENIDISEYVNIYTGYVESAIISESFLTLTVSDRRKVFDTEIDEFWEEENALQVIKETILLADTNIAYNDTYFDTTAWDAAQALAPDVTIWADEPLKTGEQIIQGAALSTFGNVTIEADGRYSFRYVNQGATAVTTIYRGDILNEYSITYDSAEVLSSVVVMSGLDEDFEDEEYCDWTRDTTREASVYASTGIYREQKFRTFLPTATAAASFATDILDYYCGIHGKLSITVPIAYYAIEIGQVIECEIDRTSKAMLGTVDCEVLGKSYNLDNNTIDFDLRIVDIPTPITPQVVSVTPQYKPTDNTYAEAVEAAIPATIQTTAPKYIGKFDTFTTAFGSSNINDWFLLYGTAGSAITPGVYYKAGVSTGIRISTSSSVIVKAKLVTVLPDIAWAEANGYGTVDDYYSFGAYYEDFAAVTAFINSLFAQNITITSPGYIQSDGYSAGTAGFKIEYDGSAEFNDITVRGSIGESGIAGGITVGNSGNIKGGQTAYDTGTGFWIGYDTVHKLSIGNSSANKLTWNGTALTVAGNINNGSTFSVIDGVLKLRNKLFDIVETIVTCSTVLLTGSTIYYGYHVLASNASWTNSIVFTCAVRSSSDIITPVQSTTFRDKGVLDYQEIAEVASTGGWNVTIEEQGVGVTIPGTSTGDSVILCFGSLNNQYKITGTVLYE